MPFSFLASYGHSETLHAVQLAHPTLCAELFSQGFVGRGVRVNWVKICFDMNAPRVERAVLIVPQRACYPVGAWDARLRREASTRSEEALQPLSRSGPQRQHVLLPPACTNATHLASRRLSGRVGRMLYLYMLIPLCVPRRKGDLDTVRFFLDQVRHVEVT